MQERILRVALVVVGLVFLAALYPLGLLHIEEGVRMMLSLYVTLGVFLLLAVRKPSAHRSLIAFTAWSSLVHASLMAGQVYYHLIARVELIGVAFFYVIGIAFFLLAPPKTAAVLRSAPAR